MKKLIYIASAPIDFAKLDGVSKKILDQCNAFYKAGFDVDIIYRTGQSILLYNIESKISKYLRKGRSYLDVLITAKKLVGEYGSVYVRYPKSEHFLISLMKGFKKFGAKIVIEIPTFPYHKEGIHSLKGRIIAYLDKFFRNQLHKYVDRICTYSADDEIFGIKTIRTINGIDFSRFIPDLTPVDSNEINLIAVSSMYIVHGYDRLIEGMYNYYKEGGDRRIHLHIIGEGDVDEDYKALVANRGLCSHVTFYGKKFGEDLNALYKQQHMGVNSLAIHRQDLTQESTLKTKEYAAMGLPIISSSYVDAFSKSGNRKYVFTIPPDETPINVKSLIGFVDSLYNENNIDKLRNAIRNEGKRTCDMINTLKPVIDFYNEEEI